MARHKIEMDYIGDEWYAVLVEEEIIQDKAVGNAVESVTAPNYQQLQFEMANAGWIDKLQSNDKD
jgi:hypothetical protein